MVKINLLAEGRRAAVRKARPSALLEGKDVGAYMLLAGLLAGLLSAAVWWWMLDNTIERKQEQIATAETELARLESVSQEVERYKAQKAELVRQIGVINDLKLAQRGPVKMMDYISRALPELLWLDRMRMSADLIEIEGRALNTNAVANFIEGLDRFPEFEEPTLKDITDQPGGTYKFVLNFRYSFAQPGAAGTAPAAGGPAAAPGGPASRIPTGGGAG